MSQTVEILRQHLIDPEICIRCNTCEETCPVDAITHDSRNYVVDPAKCNYCNDCISPCPTGAIDNWRQVDKARPYTLAEQFDEHIDEIAERITALGGVARGTLRQAAANTRLEEYPHGTHAGMQVVRALADRYASAGRDARRGVAQGDEHGDADTADLLTAISRELDKSLYFLESHLQTENP